MTRWTRGRLEDMLALDYPLVQGPFGNGLSTVDLTVAVARSGGLGSFGAHLLEPADIEAVVTRIRNATRRSFAMNLWVPRPGEADRPDPATLREHVERLRPYLDRLGLPTPEPAYVPGPLFADQARALLDARPPALSFVMGIPPGWVLDGARRAGIVTIGTATTVDEAIALEAAGLDVVVASGSDAGGHRGAFLRPVSESLVGTFALVPQVVDSVRIPVIAAGGIADGRGIAAALALGADGVQLGTGFLATDESGAAPAHRAALGTERARTTVLTRLYSGRLARVIPNRFVRELAPLENEVPPYPVQSWLTQPLRRAAAQDAEILNLTAGQAASLVTHQSAEAYVDTLVAQTEAALTRHAGTSARTR